MKERYFIIRNSDGDTTVEAISKEQLLRDINDGEYKDVMTELNDSDTNYWAGGVLIIKGKIVSPVAEQVVTKYSIE